MLILTKLFLIAGESTPKTSRVTEFVKFVSPNVGRYSWSDFSSSTISRSTCLTTGKTHALLFSSR